MAFYKTVHILVVAAMMILCQTVIGQTNSAKRSHIKFYRLNEEHGLSSNVINDIVEDDYGLIWVATEDGLFRYDGHAFQHFVRTPDDSNSLPHNSVQSLFYNGGEKIWALTDYGIGVYDYTKQGFEQILPGENTGDLPYKSVTSMCGTSGGNFFVGMFGGEGVVVYNDGHFSSLSISTPSQAAVLQDQLVSRVLVDNDSVLWIGTWNQGVLRHDLATGAIKQLVHGTDEPARVYSLFEDSFGHIWVGTNIGLSVYDKHGELSRHYRVETDPWLADNEILDVMEDDDKTIWLGTRNAGLLALRKSVLPGDSELQVEWFTPSNSNDGISHRTVSRVFQDRNSKVWLGTHNSGINVFDPHGEPVKYITRVPDELSLSHQSVWGIASNGKHLWVGTDGGGLNVVNTDNYTVDSFQAPELSDNAILSVLCCQSDQVWLGTYRGGINIYNIDKESVSLLGLKSGLMGLDVRSMFEDEDGIVWIGTNGSGLHRFDPSTERVQQVNTTAQLDVRSIEGDDDGMLWLATFGDGLVRFDTGTGELSYYNWHTEADFTPVALSLLLHGDELWIGSRQSGVLLFNKATKSFTAYSEKNGLSNNTVRSIVADNSGRIWVGTNEGVSCFDRSAKWFRNFDSSFGFQLGRFNDGSAIALENGDLAFGGIRGLNIFNPDELLSAMVAPDVAITKMRLYSSRPETHESFDIEMVNLSEVDVEYDNNSLALSFSSPGAPAMGDWNFDYMLEGYDRDWHYNESQTAATYRNLSPGDYTFLVRTTDGNGTLKGEVKSITISILPPWWRTPQAYAFYTVLIVLLISGAVALNNRQIKLKQRLIYEQKLRQQEHSDMEQKLRFFTNFSHELRTPLTLIQGPVNDLLESDKLNEHRPLLLHIKRNSTRLLKSVNRLLEFRKIETEQTYLTVGRHDLAKLARRELDAFKYQASKDNIKLVFDSDPDAFCWIDIDKGRTILTNLLSNAIKYTPEDGTISVEIRNHESTVQLSVSDTGAGIPTGQQEAVFTPFYQADNSSGKGGTGIGLALIKTLVELHSGSIKLRSDHHGSTFIVSFPNQKEVFDGKENVRFVFDEDKSIGSSDDADINHDHVDSDRPSVLAVDDHEDIREYLKEQLSDEFDVLVAEDGAEALEIALKEVPDIVISDIMMPKMDGLELCARLKSSEPTNHIPVILLTAKASDEAKVEGYKSGADSYIAKPFSSGLLKARILNLLQLRKQLKHVFASGQWSSDDSIRDTPELKFIRQAEEAIYTLIDEAEVTVPALSRQLGYSRTSLYRKIKALTDLSINQFIRVVKIKRAARMLSSDELTISEVAFALGFTDLKYFRKSFKEQLGCLPSEYKKQNRKVKPTQATLRDALGYEGD